MNPLHYQQILKNLILHFYQVTKTLENLNNGQINQCNSAEVGSSSSLGLADKLWLSGSAEMQIHTLRDGWRRCSGFSHVPQGPSVFGWENWFELKGELWKGHIFWAAGWKSRRPCHRCPFWQRKWINPELFKHFDFYLGRECQIFYFLLHLFDLLHQRI